MATRLTHCPECGRRLQGTFPVDPRKHAEYHWPSLADAKPSAENYLARKRFAMLWHDDADAEPAGGRPAVPVANAPDPDPDPD